MKVSSDRVVLFLHLLGIDTNGHSHKPYSEEYLQNIALVDSGIRDTVELVEDLFEHDGKTAYVLTADHGMTNWGKCLHQGSLKGEMALHKILLLHMVGSCCISRFVLF